MPAQKKDKIWEGKVINQTITLTSPEGLTLTYNTAVYGNAHRLSLAIQKDYGLTDSETAVMRATLLEQYYPI